MTKSRLIKEVSKKMNLSKKEAEKIVKVFLESIQDTLQSGKHVRFTGFGTFDLLTRKERKGRHPQTGQEIVIPANKTIKFKPGKSLREKIK